MKQTRVRLLGSGRCLCWWMAEQRSSKQQESSPTYCQKKSPSEIQMAATLRAFLSTK